MIRAKLTIQCVGAVGREWGDLSNQQSWTQSHCMYILVFDVPNATSNSNTYVFHILFDCTNVYHIFDQKKTVSMKTLWGFEILWNGYAVVNGVASMTRDKMRQVHYCRLLNFLIDIDFASCVASLFSLSEKCIGTYNSYSNAELKNKKYRSDRPNPRFSEGEGRRSSILLKLWLCPGWWWRYYDDFVVIDSHGNWANSLIYVFIRM